MSEVLVGCLGLIVLIALFLTGIELSFCMILVGFLGFAYLVDFQAAMHLVARDLYDAFASYGYTVFPIFILMGQVAFASGIAKKLYDIFREDSLSQRSAEQPPLKHFVVRQQQRQRPLPVWPSRKWIGMGIARRFPPGLWQL
jgi:hypothetical protein